MRPLRLITVLPSFDWRFGGSIGQARLIASSLAQRGHQVSVLTTDLGTDSASAGAWEECDGFRLFRARTAPQHRQPPYRAPTALLDQLERMLPDTDLVTTQVGLTLLNSSVAMRCRRQGVPFVYSAQGALDPERLKQKRLRKILFMLVYERPLLRRAAALQALTASEARDLRRHGAPADRIAVLPNAVPATKASAAEGQETRRSWGIPESAGLILSIGRLAPEKGWSVGLEAAAPVLTENPELRLVLAGPDAGSGDSLRQLAEALGIGRQVLFPGPIEPARRAQALAAADLFACPSRSEGLPLAVLEAAAAGLPLWISERCNIPEVSEYQAGIEAAYDAPSLETALRRILADPALATTMGHNAERMVDERFSLGVVVDRIEALYRDLVDAES